MSSFRIRTMLGRAVMASPPWNWGAPRSQPAAAGAIEQMGGGRREVQADLLPLGQAGQLAGAQLHALALDLEVDDAAVAEVLDELDPARDAGAGDAQVGRTD